MTSRPVDGRTHEPQQTLIFKDPSGSDIASDLTIHCGGRLFKVHASHVIMHSRVLGMDIDHFSSPGPFTIALSGNDEYLVELALRFMYSGTKYRQNKRIGEDNVIFYSRLAQFAYEWQILELYKHAIDEFRVEVSINRRIEILLAAVPLIFKQLPDENNALRDPVVDKVAKEYAVLLATDWNSEGAYLGGTPIVAFRSRVIDQAVGTLHHASSRCPAFAVAVQKKLCLAIAGVRQNGIEMTFATDRVKCEKYVQCLDCCEFANVKDLDAGLFCMEAPAPYTVFEGPDDEVARATSTRFVCQNCLFDRAIRNWKKVVQDIENGKQNNFSVEEENVGGEEPGTKEERELKEEKSLFGG